MKRKRKKDQKLTWRMIAKIGSLCLIDAAGSGTGGSWDGFQSFFALISGSVLFKYDSSCFTMTPAASFARFSLQRQPVPEPGLNFDGLVLERYNKHKCLNCHC
jgi:hypothetical protein